jgi:succinoglycan biosynthesis protein ExoM
VARNERSPFARRGAHPMNREVPPQSADVVVVVGLPTFRRPRELQRAIPAILSELATLRGAQARLVVVDNDPDASAEAIASAYPGEYLEYVHEPVPGIAAARNRAISEAGTADAIIFIDDDEVPVPGWLQSLVDAWQRWQCAAVTGPVTSLFDGPADEWVRASGVFSRQVRPTGSVNPGASSANLLLDLSVLRKHAIRFDDDFGITGGSDTMLAHTLRAKGEQIRWCQEAEVSEHVPPQRSTHDWVFKRTVRTSNTWSRVAMRLAETPRERLRARSELSARGSYRVARGVMLRGTGQLRRDVTLDARGAIDVASGIGILMGAFGMVRTEYARTGIPPQGRRLTRRPS